MVMNRNISKHRVSVVPLIAVIIFIIIVIIIIIVLKRKVMQV
jgi:hypothetical protein